MSARFRVRAPGPVSGQLYETTCGGRANCLDFLSPFGHRPSLLGHPGPPGSWAPLAVGLPAHPKVRRTLTGFPCSTRMRFGWGWVSSIPRRQRCPHGQAMSLTAVCRISTTRPWLPGNTTRPGKSQSRGINKTSLSFTPCPAFPSPVTPRRSGSPWAFPWASHPTEQDPAAHAKAGTGLEHWPGLRPRHQSNLLRRTHSQRATSRRNIRLWWRQAGPRLASAVGPPLA